MLGALLVVEGEPEAGMDALTVTGRRDANAESGIPDSAFAG